MKNKYILYLEKEYFKQTKMLRGYFEIEETSFKCDLDEKDATMFLYFLDNKEDAQKYINEKKDSVFLLFLSDIVSDNIESLKVNYI